MSFGNSVFVHEKLLKRRGSGEVFAPIQRIGAFVLFRDCADHLAGNARRDDVRGDVFSDDAPRADDGVIPDGYARKDDCARADPYVVADRYGFCDLDAVGAHLWIDGVFRRGENAVGRDENVVPETHFRAVLDNGVVIGVEKIAHFYVVAVIAPERGDDGNFFPHRAEQFLQDLFLRAARVGAEFIIAETQAFPSGDRLFVSGVVTALEKTIGGDVWSFVHRLILAVAHICGGAKLSPEVDRKTIITQFRQQSKEVAPPRPKEKARKKRIRRKCAVSIATNKKSEDF